MLKIQQNKTSAVNAKQIYSHFVHSHQATAYKQLYNQSSRPLLLSPRVQCALSGGQLLATVHQMHSSRSPSAQCSVSQWRCLPQSMRDDARPRCVCLSQRPTVSHRPPALHPHTHTHTNPNLHLCSQHSTIYVQRKTVCHDENVLILYMYLTFSKVTIDNYSGLISKLQIWKKTNSGFTFLLDVN